MAWIHLTYFISSIITVVLMAVISLYSWHNRKNVPGAITYSLISGLLSLLVLFEVMIMVSSSENAALIWFNFRYISFAAIPVLWIIFVLQYSGKSGTIKRFRLYFLFIIPAATQIIIWTGNLHGLWVLRNVGFYRKGYFLFTDTSLRISGPWLKFHYLYTYTLMLAGIILLLYAALRLYRKQRIQALLLGSGTMIMILGSLFPAFNPVPSMKLNPMPQSFALGSILIAWGIYRHRFLYDTPVPDYNKKIPTILITLFVLMASCIVATGYYNYSKFREYNRKETGHSLQAIAELKVNQIKQWRNERTGDGSIFFNNKAFYNIAQRYFADGSDSDSRSQIISWLTKIQSSHGYDQVFLINSRNDKLLSIPVKSYLNCNDWFVFLEDARKLRKVFLTDFHRESPDKPAHLSIIVPLIDEYPGAAVKGYIILVINPGNYLYPLIEQWPEPSETAETLLVRRDGNDVLFLNELRFRKNTALNLRIPLADPDLPAVMAVNGYNGVVEGIDYRGEHVAAALTAVPDTTWHIVSKIDTREIYEPVMARFWMMVIVVLVSISAAGYAIGFIWRKQSEIFYRQQYKSAQELIESSRKLKEAQEMARLGYWTWDIKTGNVEWSEEVFKIFGLSPDEFKPQIGSILALSPWPDENKRDLEIISRAIEDHSPGSYEQKFLRPDNSIGYYYSTFQGNYDVNGGLVSVVGTILDITERKLADEALRKSEDLFSKAFHGSPAPMTIARRNDGSYIEVNESFLKMVECGRDETIGHNGLELNLIEPEGMTEILNKLHANEKVHNIEIKARTKSGTILNVLTSIENVFLAGEECTITTMLDITERKLAEERLIKSEERYRTTLDNMLEGCQILGFDLEYIYINNAAEKHNKRPKDEMLGKRYIDLWPGIENTSVYSYITRCLVERKSHQMENKFVFTDGKVGWFDLSIQPVPEGVFILSIDISERKSTEDKLSNAYARLERMFSSNVIGVIIADADGGLFEVNDYYLNLLGYTRDEFETGAIRWDERTPPEFIQADLKAIDELRQRGVCTPYEKEYFRKDGSRVSVLLADVLLPGAEEQIFALIIDVTERHRAEKALRKSEQRLRSFYESDLMGVIYWNMNGEISDANDKFLEITGYTREDLANGEIDWINMTPREYSNLDDLSVKELKTTGVNKTPFEKEYIRKDGTRIPVLVAGAMLDEDRFEGVAFLLDITERKKAEKERIFFTDELERSNLELQQFAYVASHDLQEPLRMISSYLQLIERRYKDKLDQDATDFINFAVDGAKRMQSLIVGLLDFSRIRTHGRPFTRFNVADILNLVFKDLEVQIKETEAIVEYGEMPFILADETQIPRLFQNLIQNAVKYRRDGVKPHITITSENSGNGYIFCVRDNGIGIENQYFERIFTIFQRLHAREEYPGTGIGLSICKRIVERHNGKIWLKSEPGEGTSFYFNIPGELP